MTSKRKVTDLLPTEAIHVSPSQDGRVFDIEPIPTEAEKVEVDEGSTIESVFKLTKWILENRVSSLIDADIPQEDKDRIARHFGYSADLTNP